MEDKLTVEWVEASSIRPYEKNAKEHTPDQVDKIVQSLREYGWRQPIVVDKDNVIVCGHGRYQAALKLGGLVPIVRADDLSEKQIKGLRLADNKTNESLWDNKLLIEELSDLSDIFTGFDESDLFFSNLEEADKILDEVETGIAYKVVVTTTDKKKAEKMRDYWEQINANADL